MHVTPVHNVLEVVSQVVHDMLWSLRRDTRSHVVALILYLEVKGEHLEEAVYLCDVPVTAVITEAALTLLWSLVE
jgi:hypothetical protein